MKWGFVNCRCGCEEVLFKETSTTAVNTIRIVTVNTMQRSCFCLEAMSSFV